jgi:phosphoribosylpyrophosphate synthetase
MNLVVVAGSGNPSLADSIAERLGTRVCRSVLNRFPDTELHAEIEESVRGCDVYVVQSTGPPVCGELLISPESAIRHTQDQNGNIVAVAAAWQRAECIASDDPRLKPK